MTLYCNTKIKFPIIIKQISSYDIFKLIIRKSNVTNKIILGIISSPLTININTCSPYNYGLFCEKIFDYIKYCNNCKNNKFNFNRLDYYNCCFCFSELKPNKYRKHAFGAVLLNFPTLVNNDFTKKTIHNNFIESIKYLIHENYEYNSDDSKFLIKIICNQLSKFILNNNKLIFINTNKKKEYLNYSSSIKNILTLLFPILPTYYRKLIKNNTNSSNINKHYSKLIEINNILTNNWQDNLNSLNIIYKLNLQILKLTNLDKTFKINKKMLLNLQKKEGILRTLLLGCRSDYSSRIVIIPGSDLNIISIGIPLNVAKYILSGYISNNKKRNIINTSNFKIQLNNVIKYNHIITNRPPTLHKMNIQSFSPVLVENKAIKLGPLSCVGYNADFDGDQMSLFAPYLTSSNIESKTKLRSSANIKSPTTYKNIVYPTQSLFTGYFNVSIFDEFFYYKNIKNNFNINLTYIIELCNFFSNSIISENKILLKIKDKFELTTINRTTIKFNNIIFNF